MHKGAVSARVFPYTVPTVALPPTIPTSFVPKQPVAAMPARRAKSGVNVFMIIGASVAAASVVIAGAVFAYEFYLKGAHASKTVQLEEAQKAVNIDTVEDFIRLRGRLAALESLLDEHVILSEFFDLLELRTLQTVRFSGLKLSVDEDRSAEIQMEGVAKNFNALAAQSTQLAAEKQIKRAIFSGISLNENGTVSFSLSASIEPRLITSAEVLPGISEPEEPASASNIVPATLPGAPLATTTTKTATTTAPAKGTSTPPVSAPAL